jgi:hypothetical protein
MARVIILKKLKEDIFKKFGGESKKIIRLILSLEDNPKKGKLIGQVGGVAIKELKYKSFRFYFVTDGFKLKFLDIGELESLFIKFIRMSDKKSQQKTINEIKSVLRKLGESGF